MKYLIVLGDGMADYKCGEIGGLTPLQYAHTPNLDRLASMGWTGMVKTVPDGMAPGSDVANLSVFGYDPLVCYTGRAPLEAVSMRIKLGPDDVAFRCNLVTLSGEEVFEKKTMVDYSAGEIDSARSAVLINELNSFLAREDIRIYPGISYRHLMVWSGGPVDAVLTPPHDISGREIAAYLPNGAGSRVLMELIKKGHAFLQGHRLNGPGETERPANSIWFWGQGKSPALKSFKDKFNLSGAVISAVDLIKGIGICAGLKVIEVPGATGNIRTNFAGKAAAAVEAFRSGSDFVYIHIEAPDESGHQGNLNHKLQSIEQIDGSIVGPLMEQMKEFGDFRMMVLPDHPTPLAIKTHTSDPVPYVIYDSRSPQDNAGAAYCEEFAAAGRYFGSGVDLMNHFIYG